MCVRLTLPGILLLVITHHMVQWAPHHLAARVHSQSMERESGSEDDCRASSSRVGFSMATAIERSEQSIYRDLATCCTLMIPEQLLQDALMQDEDKNKGGAPRIKHVTPDRLCTGTLGNHALRRGPRRSHVRLERLGAFGIKHVIHT